MTPQEARRCLGERTREKVRAFLARGPATYPEIMHGTDLGYSTVERAIQWLRTNNAPEAQNHIRRIGKPPSKPKTEKKPWRLPLALPSLDASGTVASAIRSRTALEMAWAGECDE